MDKVRKTRRSTIFSSLEQGNVRGLYGRGPRLEMVLGLAVALALPALARAAQDAPNQATQTTLTTTTHDADGRTEAELAIAVRDGNGQPASGSVSILDHGQAVASVALDSDGKASSTVQLAAGDHSLRAAYTGNATYKASHSTTAAVSAQSTGTPDYTVSVGALASTLSTDAAGTLTPGQSGTAAVTITPENASALTAPLFVNLSCSGLPDQASCSFTPATVEIQSTTSGTLTSTILIETQKASKSSVPATKSTTALGWLIPGSLGLMGLAFGAHRRRWLSRVALVALLGLVTIFGTSACGKFYNYYNHGPIANPATPAGTYTVTIAAQSTNGVSATIKTTTLALTIN